MQKIIYTLLLLTLSMLSVAQFNNSPYYFVTKTDTIFCNSLSYETTIQGFLCELHYETINGNKVDLKGRKKVPDVLTFYMAGDVYDKVPYKYNNPKYIRYDRRKVNGKLIVYLEKPQQIRMTGGDFGMNHTQTNNSAYGHSGPKRFFIKFPDGKMYKAGSAGHMKEFIKPYLQQCPEFVAQYKGDYSRNPDLFMEMIAIYNSLCK